MTNYFILSPIQINELKEAWIWLGIESRSPTYWANTLPLDHQLHLSLGQSIN